MVVNRTPPSPMSPLLYFGVFEQLSEWLRSIKSPSFNPWIIRLHNFRCGDSTTNNLFWYVQYVISDQCGLATQNEHNRYLQQLSDVVAALLNTKIKVMFRRIATVASVSTSLTKSTRSPSINKTFSFTTSLHQLSPIMSTASKLKSLNTYNSHRYFHYQMPNTLGWFSPAIPHHASQVT